MVDLTGPLQTGLWYRVAFVAKVVTGATNEQYLSLWVNSEQVGSITNRNTNQLIDNSSWNAVFGADFGAESSLDSFIS